VYVQTEECWLLVLGSHVDIVADCCQAGFGVDWELEAGARGFLCVITGESLFKYSE
jgi:hypothetical protein